MTSAPKRPAGAPEDWDRKEPAGAPAPEGTTGARGNPAGPGPEAEERGSPAAPGREAEERGSPAAPGREAEDAAGSDSAVEADLDALLADVRRERDEYLELAQRAKADFENYRRRSAREAADAEQRGKAELARGLVPALDNLDRALAAAEDADSPLAKGVALVLSELRAALERSGVEAYDPLGERFDPAWHEALQTRPSEEAEAGVVIETLERGYRLDGRVLRPARVVVSG